MFAHVVYLILSFFVAEKFLVLSLKSLLGMAYKFRYFQVNMELSTMLNSMTLRGARLISPRLMSSSNQTVPLFVIGTIRVILFTSGFEGI